MVFLCFSLCDKIFYDEIKEIRTCNCIDNIYLSKMRWCIVENVHGNANQNGKFQQIKRKADRRIKSNYVRHYFYFKRSYLSRTSFGSQVEMIPIQISYTYARSLRFSMKNFVYNNDCVYNKSNLLFRHLKFPIDLFRNVYVCDKFRLVGMKNLNSYSTISNIL